MSEFKVGDSVERLCGSKFRTGSFQHDVTGIEGYKVWVDAGYWLHPIELQLVARVQELEDM